MQIILYLYDKCKEIIGMNMPMSILKTDNIFERIIAIKYDVPNDQLGMFSDYKIAIDNFYNKIMETNA